MHHLDEEEERVPSGPHVVAQQAYYEARQRADMAKAVYSEAYRAQKEAETKLVECMMDLGITRLDYMRDGTKIHFQGKCSVSITQENEEEVRQWLRERYGDDMQFSTEKLDKPAVTAKIKEDLHGQELSETEVPKHMKLNQFPGLSVTGWKTR